MFIDELRATDKKGIFKSNDNMINYSTGIIPLDYCNGYWQEIIDESGESRYVPITGIIGGTFISIIGTVGAGKTTLAVQMGFNIIKNFEDSVLFFVDAEKTMLKNRLIKITGTSPHDERIVLNKEHTSIEDILIAIDNMCALKESKGSAYMYEVKDKSFNGKPFKVYIPTVIIIDSLPSFNSNTFVTDSLGNNIDQMRASKDISRFYTNCLDKILRYNITIIVINHIRSKTDINPFSTIPNGLMMLKKDETLARGQVAQYFSHTYFRLNTSASKSNTYTEEEYGFSGFRCSIQLAKSKTNLVGATIPVAFIGKIGFDPVFSLFEYADSIGIIAGRNPNLYIEGLNTFKFSKKNFRTKFLHEKSFRDAVLNVLKLYLEPMLGTKEVSNEERIRYGDLEISDNLLVEQQIKDDDVILDN